MAQIYRFKVTIEDLDQPVWRVILIPGDATFLQLHEVLQVAFEWDDSEQHIFRIRQGTRRFVVVPPEDLSEFPTGMDEEKTQIADLFKNQGQQGLYTYDTKDEWEHFLELEAIEAAEATEEYPQIIDGEKMSPPEEAAGAKGYNKLRTAVQDPDHPSHERALEILDLDSADDFDDSMPPIEDLNEMISAEDQEEFEEDEEEDETDPLDQDAEIDPVPVSGGAMKPEPELDVLSNIVRAFNDQFGNIEWDDEEQVWGLHVWRWMHRLGEEAQFQLLPRDGVGTVYHFGELRGIRGLDPQRRVELLPYTMGKVSTFEPEDGNPFADGFGQRAGLGVDAKVGITSAFTLDMTLNPDFGQVEADPSVINLSAFETFYQEKRPFFLEGSNLFAFSFEGNAAFYSRRIGGVPHYDPTLDDGEYVGMPEVTTILGAAKLTGKTRNGLSVGVLESLTTRESAPVEGPTGRRHVVVEPLTNYFVGRIEKEFDQGNTVLGGLLTSVHRSNGEDYLHFLNREAYVGGVNFTHYWGNRTYFVDAMAVASGVRGEPEALIRAQRSSARSFQRPDADYVTLESGTGCVHTAPGHGLEERLIREQFV